MKLTVIKEFDWAHRGVEIEKFEKGAVIDTEDADLIKVATDEGWAKKSGKADASTPAE